MTSMARSNPLRTTERVGFVLALGALLLGLCAPMSASARTSDRDKKIKIQADHSQSHIKANGVTNLDGHVVITQGTLKATGTHATIHLDADSHVKRVKLEGSPAHLQQQDDSGTLIKGHANTIDYHVTQSVAKLTGNAFVKKVGKSRVRGDRLVYNTQASTLTADSTGGRRVHMTLQPQDKASSEQSDSETSEESANRDAGDESDGTDASGAAPAHATTTNKNG